ncbi:UDP-glucose 4-epimerase GalE [Aquicoccus sp. G2-2]|uniref:UDP-glucose 4-epimerase GalE n=1 Tax=Aquicoccus sp. G2-2 TaxID=3092120 RepID=UPI002ADF3801|nr:UDP-glucose 4-epimerase GalE [Aquicoccus sp. G2-2]MEA1114911.1 UDP-glucose 4-epimerase GalE [Aquicoccus sp. G2-2]
MTARILLTGGAGYIGSHTYVALKAAGHDVAILDNFSNSRPTVLNRLETLTGAPVEHHLCDVCDAPAVMRLFADNSFDAVVHFAARKAVGESMREPLTYFNANIGGFINVLRAMEQSGTNRLVFSSSATIYGDPDMSPIPETAERRYANPYGYTKIACEQMMEQLCTSNPAWQFGVLRYFNPVGAHASALIGEDPMDIPNNLMPYIAKVATGELPRINIFGADYATPDGTGVRDYIHVEDLARGHVLSLEALLAGKGGHSVNLGTGKGISVLEVIAAYSAACGRALPYEIAPRREGDVPSYYADPSLAQTLLGFRAERDLDDMCRSSWAWVSGQLSNTPKP